MVPGASGGGSSGGWKPVLELIAKHEAVGGSYDSIYPSSKKDGLSQMTIAQADAWQASTASSRGSAAAGRYQFMYIKDQAADAGIGPDEMFSPENQDKMAISLIEKKRGVTLDMMKSNPDEAMIRLGMEWASLPMPKDMQGGSRSVKAGQSYYAGDGRNKAGASINEVRKAMGAVESVTPSNVSSPSSGSSMISSGNRSSTPGPPSCVCPPKAPKIVAPPSSPQSQGGSAAVGNQSKRDGFSPIDLGNPDLLVVKSIYNIVG
jgi:muramidase (phage lysozyme)